MQKMIEYQGFDKPTMRRSLFDKSSLEDFCFIVLDEPFNMHSLPEDGRLRSEDVGRAGHWETGWQHPLSERP